MCAPGCLAFPTGSALTTRATLAGIFASRARSTPWLPFFRLSYDGWLTTVGLHNKHVREVNIGCSRVTSFELC